MYNFEKLLVWQEAMKLSEMAYEIAKKLPVEEKFALSDQLRRASTSVCLNIAEGSGSKSRKFFASFIEISIKSLYETITIFKLIERIYKVNCTKELEQCDLINKLAHGLLNSIKPD